MTSAVWCRDRYPGTAPMSSLCREKRTQAWPCCWTLVDTVPSLASRIQKQNQRVGLFSATSQKSINTESRERGKPPAVHPIDITQNPSPQAPPTILPPSSPTLCLLRIYPPTSHYSKSVGGRENVPVSLPGRVPCPLLSAVLAIHGLGMSGHPWHLTAVKRLLMA